MEPGGRSATLPGVEPDLIRRAQRGDTRAVTALLDDLVPYVGRICASIAVDDAEDATQEALVVILGNLGSLREPLALWSWSRRIAVHEALRLARRRTRAGVATDPERLAWAQAALDVNGSDGTTSVDVREVLRQLTPDQRVLLVMRHMGDFGDDEMAELLDVPPGTVKSRVFRARAAFRTRWTA
jgi:RNA polymerase sigma factor (sigma-70 family)